MKPVFFVAMSMAVLLVLCASSSACALRPKSGDIVMRVKVPTGHVDTYVVEGSLDDAAVPGRYPVHYQSTNLPSEGQTIVVSGHHFTPQYPGAAGGAFLRLNEAKLGSFVFIREAARFGGGTYKYVITSNRPVYCGPSRHDFYYCERALNLLKNFKQTKVYLITCIGDGHWRRIVTAFLVKKGAALNRR
jgi:sortase (surface protein transpeptidase)